MFCNEHAPRHELGQAGPDDGSPGGKSLLNVRCEGPRAPLLREAFLRPSRNNDVVVPAHGGSAQHTVAMVPVVSACPSRVVCCCAAPGCTHTPNSKTHLDS